MRNSTRSGESQKEQSRRLTGMGIRAGGGGVTRGGASGRVTGSLLLVEGEERLSDDVVVEDLGALIGVGVRGQLRVQTQARREGTHSELRAHEPRDEEGLANEVEGCTVNVNTQIQPQARFVL